MRGVEIIKSVNERTTLEVDAVDPQVGPQYLANMPWYDLPIPKVQAAHDKLWEIMCEYLLESGVSAPKSLNREDEMDMIFEQIKDSRLLLGQACGYDVAGPYRDYIEPLATPSFSAPGCLPNSYSSYIVVREGSPYFDIQSLKGARAAVNGVTSHSGFSSLRAAVYHLKDENESFFGATIISGAHMNSLEMVREGSADVAAIDVVTFALLKAHRPSHLEGIRIIAQTRNRAAPPFVTSRSTQNMTKKSLKKALFAAFSDERTAEARRVLMLDGVSTIPFSEYKVLMCLCASKDGCTKL